MDQSDLKLSLNYPIIPLRIEYVFATQRLSIMGELQSRGALIATSISSSYHTSPAFDQSSNPEGVAMS